MHGPTRQSMRERLALLEKRAKEASSSRAGVLAVACVKEERRAKHGKSSVVEVGVSNR